MDKTMDKRSPTCSTKRKRESSPAPNSSKRARLTSWDSFDSDDEDYSHQELNKIIGDRFDDLANFIESELKRSNEKKCQEKKIAVLGKSQIVISEVEYLENAVIKDNNHEETDLSENCNGPCDDKHSISYRINDEDILVNRLPTTPGNSVPSEKLLTKSQQPSSPPREKRRHAHSQNNEFILQTRHRPKSDALNRSETTTNGPIKKQNSRPAVRKPKTLAKLRKTFQKKYTNCFGIP